MATATSVSLAVLVTKPTLTWDKATGPGHDHWKLAVPPRARAR
jgi:hypothetical protein